MPIFQRNKPPRLHAFWRAAIVAAVLLSLPTVGIHAATSTAAIRYATPIDHFYSRVTKKPFGMYVTPATSPIRPERFRGYHAGADAETTSAEKKKDIPVFAVTVATVAYTGWVRGYGGVIVLRFTDQGKTYTALYGHVRQSSITVRAGQKVVAGKKLAVLGTGYSTQTDGERKHLHFSIHRGSGVVFLGYVQQKSQLSAWVDPVAWLKSRGVR